MKSQVLLLSLFASVSAMSAVVRPASEPAPAPTPVPAPTPAPAAGPRPTGALRIVTPDGATVIAQAALASGTALNTLTVDAKSAFLKSGGKCAFNLKYDEISDLAAFQTTNRLYDNDALIAQNTRIDLAPGLLKTTWTQAYLLPGQNNLRLVINAEGTAPSTAWVRVAVSGACGDSVTPPPPPPPASAPAPAPAPTPAPPVTFAPGSTQWNALYTAFGYSNYGVNGLKGKGYARYDELVKLNADLAAVVKAGKVESGAWGRLMDRWNSFNNDAAFKAAMATIVPGNDGKPGTPPPTTTPPAPTPAPVVNYAPGSSQWNALYTAFGYSNYGVNGLKGKGYARYDELVKLNADITAVVKAGKVEAGAWGHLMDRWNSFVNDAAFKAAMATIVPGTDGKH